MKAIKLTAIAAALLSITLMADAKSPESNSLISVSAQSSGHVGTFEAEGKKIDVKFVRVLYAAEGSERAGEGDSVEQLVFDSIDPQGNPVKVYRFQITAKNTGYDKVQTSKEADFKMKSVKEGVKLHVEIPLQNGALELDKAYIGNVAYNFGTRETRHILKPETISDIRFKVNKLDLPAFDISRKPGDDGIIYNQGFIDFTMTSKAKHIKGDQIGDFNIQIQGPISLTHVRGKERHNKAVNIDEGIVKQNIQ